MTKPAFHICALTGVEAFREGILFCQHSLEALGYPVTVGHGQLNKDAINILFGSYVTDWKTLSSQASRIIVYNWEQVGVEVPWFTQKYLRQLVNTEVWDYNQRNVRQLEQAGVQHIQYVPLGYVPQLRKDHGPVEQDIDVLFYGTINDRRKKVLDAIRAKGLKVVSTETGYLLGDERDAHIARAKVVLNVHYYERAGIFEVARISYLLANSKAVVSELAEHTDIEEDIKDSIAHGSLDELPDLCAALVVDVERRRALEKKGFAQFSKRNGAAIMAQAVDHYLATEKSNTNKQILAKPPVFIPRTMQIGAGERWRFDRLNVDAKEEMGPDVVVDFNQPLPLNQNLPAWRFDSVSLKPAYFQHILADNFFQTATNMQQALHNCLDLLEDGGLLEFEVPHDLSLEAWASIDNRRSFNEKSWRTIADNWWKYGFTTHRFELANQSTIIRGDFGAKKLAELNNDWDEILKIPRAVDALRVWLRKRPVTEEETKQLPQKRFLD